MENYFVHESSYVDEGCQIGKGTKIWHFSHVMSGCIIGEDCNIGQNVVISPDVVLGRNCKIQNNVFSSQERAQQESNRLEKKRQSIDEKSVKYSNELDLENRQNSQQVSEAIDAYVKEYNKSHGFNLILTRSSLVYADDVMNITAEILEGLNAEYKSSNK